MGILCCHKAQLVATPYLSVATPGARARQPRDSYRLLQLSCPRRYLTEAFVAFEELEAAIGL